MSFGNVWVRWDIWKVLKIFIEVKIMRAEAVNDRTKLLMFSFLWFRIDAYFHVIGIEIRPITSEFRNAFWLEGSKMCICAIYWWLFSENLTPQMKFYATSRAYSNRKHIQVTTKLFKKRRKVRVDNLIAFVWCGRAVHLLNGKKFTSTNASSLRLSTS